MTAATSELTDDYAADPTGRLRRFQVTPALELMVLGVAIVIAVATYFTIAGSDASQRLLTPPLVALLLVANLVPAVALLVLFGRRIAQRRAARSAIGGRGQLHVRLVAIFSMLAAVPMILVTIFASLLFQYGVEFWFSDRARGMLENASVLVRENYDEKQRDVARETATMASDVANYLKQMPIESQQFRENFALQVYSRELSEAVIGRPLPSGEWQTDALVNPYDRRLDRVITPAMIAQLKGASSVSVASRDRTATLTRLDYRGGSYLYAARVFDPQLLSQIGRGETILADYRALQQRSRTLQLQFNAALMVVSLLIVGIAVWIALAVADRLVRPVLELVTAARAIEGGDLTARVAEDPRRQDEVGTLANAFNQMTGRLQAQTGALENRRALLEAVMGGVSAGVISIDRERLVRVINRSAVLLLAADADSPLGRPLAALAPELDTLVDSPARDAIVEMAVGADPRTLAVKVARTEAGTILTFDDITQAQLEQRRAAWCDVARRVAHEIKNPLTPIQLAAERLQRRYGKTVEAGDTTFAKLTDTIVRQVGDLRRMVDEFSSFARMPKPVFAEESVVDIVRQAVFLHEVAHADIAFSVVHDEPEPTIVCDRRQLGQAMTNILKNAVEAVEARGGGGGAIAAEVHLDAGRLTITVADDGVGLPAERERITEPYMTTRARGTGLGLAIVSKIVEEHFGQIGFADRPGGGTVVTIALDANALARIDGGAHAPADHAPELRPAALSRSGGS